MKTCALASAPNARVALPRITMKRLITILCAVLTVGVTPTALALHKPNDPHSSDCADAQNQTESSNGTTLNIYCMSPHREAIRAACSGSNPCTGHAPVIHIDRTDYYIDGMAYWDNRLGWDAMYVGYRRQPYTVPTIQVTNTPHPGCNPNGIGCAWFSPSQANLCWVWVHPDYRDSTDGPNMYVVGGHEIGHCLGFSHEWTENTTGYNGIMYNSALLQPNGDPYPLASSGIARDGHLCSSALYRCPFAP